MAQTFTVTGKLAIPLEEGGSVAPIDLGVSLVILNRADFGRSYAGAVTDDAVNLGTLTSNGAKGILVKCTSGSCTVKFNAGATAWPLAVGGYFLWVNPSTAFATAALVTTSGPATVVFLAVG